VYRHRLAVVVEKDDLEEPARSVGVDVEVAVALVQDACGVADRMLDVFVGDTVLAGVVRDLHHRRLTCEPTKRKLTCGKRKARGEPSDLDAVHDAIIRDVLAGADFWGGVSSRACQDLLARLGRNFAAIHDQVRRG
jgi:hypothetical protein